MLKVLKKNQKHFAVAGALFIAFVVWTAIILLVGVNPVGPNESVVGLAGLNVAFHKFTGVHLVLYDVTDILSIIPLMIIGFFAVLGVIQLVKRKSLKKVDYEILALGVYYIVVLALFFLFEALKVNYRPILIEGKLEASYPSSTTLLVLTVLPTAILWVKNNVKKGKIGLIINVALAVFALFMLVCRTISGVHWITDIIGGVLLASSLFVAYLGATKI